MAKKPTKRRAAKPKVKIVARIAQAGSIREFSDAVLRNLDAAYWETASNLLDGNVPEDSYLITLSRLLALKEAGLIVRDTLLDGDDEAREDAEEIRNGQS